MLEKYQFNNFYFSTNMSLGVTMILAGIILRYVVNRARFNRRNVGGIEEHKSYEHAVSFNLLCTVGKLAGLGLILIGVLYFFAGVGGS